MTDAAVQTIAPTWPRDWPVPANLRVLTTTVNSAPANSANPYGGFNLGLHVGDDANQVREHRALLHAEFELPPIQWLSQVHGSAIVQANRSSALASADSAPTADAALAGGTEVALAILSADCLPIVLFEPQGQWIANLHGGWRGLVRGVIGQTVEALAGQVGSNPEAWMAWIGPSISMRHYEVGAEVAVSVRDCVEGPDQMLGLSAGRCAGKYQLDLSALAMALLNQAGVQRVCASRLCSFADPRFYSHRRAMGAGLAQTGRMATLVWLVEP
ncbi:MAG: peptidoglycan editing factor PgeF [Pseudomonadales bacterium]